MDKFLKSKWFYRLLALVLAILLFMYVNQSRLKFSSQRATNSRFTQQLSLTKRARITVPLQLNVNNRKYFVTGYPERVTVNLKGPSALVSTVMNTQNFEADANLSELGVGRHRIRVAINGLNSEVKSRVSPSKINVDVQPRRTINVSPTIKYDHSKIAPGYHVKGPLTLSKSVKVSGAADSVRRIHKVIALVTLSKDSKHTVHAKAAFEALDKNGRFVDVILTPSTTNVRLPIVKDND